MLLLLYTPKQSYRSIPATGNRHLTKMDLKRSFIAHSNSVASYQGSRRALLLGGNKALGGGAMMGIRKVSARPA